MLKARLITAAILVPLLLFAILYAPPFVLLGLLLFVLGLAASEWQYLVPLQNRHQQGLFWGCLLISAVLSLYFFLFWMGMGLLLWVLAIGAVVTYPASVRIWGKPIWVAFLGCVFLPLLGACVVGLYQKPHGAGLMIYVLALVSVSDSGAYFTGKRWGKHALISRVSAGKTIEGAIGGMVLPMAVAWLGASFFSPVHLLRWFGLALLTVLVAMFGDLTLSMLKRRQQLKDTGSLLPGHGGVLDRLDSVLAALPWFYMGYYYGFPELF